jgi:predicted HicB family RNase H-like nuclease
MQSRVVNFRAAPSLVAALVAQARREGVSLSELVRSAARERVGLQ